MKVGSWLLSSEGKRCVFHIGDVVACRGMVGKVVRLIQYRDHSFGYLVSTHQRMFLVGKEELVSLC